MKKFNINYEVRVKLTQVGIDELERQHNELYEHLPKSIDREFKKPSVDDDGYSKFQMWCLISSLGHLCRMGLEQPFETEILIEDNLLK